MYWLGAHWRNLANSIEPSTCGGDAAFLSNYSDHLLLIAMAVLYDMYVVQMARCAVENVPCLHCKRPSLYSSSQLTVGTD